MQVKAFLGWSCSIILCVVYSLFLSTYGFFLFLSDTLSSFVPILFVTLFALFVGCCLIAYRVCRKRGLDSSGYWRCAVIIILSIPIIVLMQDAPPIEQDYVLQDIVPTDQNILQSYDTVMLLRKDEVMKEEAIITWKIYFQLQTNVLAHSELIYHAWDSIAEARSIIEKLNTYPGITDLTSQVELGTNTPTLSFHGIRSIDLTYTAYAILKTAEGDPDEAARHLATLHNVARKALPHAALLIDKMIWIAIANNNIENAFTIMQNVHCTPNTLRILKESFLSIPEEDVSLRRVFIGEYVTLKTICNVDLKPSNFLDAVSMTEVGAPTKVASLIRKTASSLIYLLTFRKNRTFRDLRKHYDLLIDGAGKHPIDMTDADAFADNYFRYPDIRNMGGWYFASFAVPSFVKCGKSVIKTKVLSDLLAVEIGNRLNEPVALQDYYSNQLYKRDSQTGQVFSVGPDMKPSSNDDIALGEK